MGAMKIAFERKGQGIHTQSDFGRPLYAWGEDLFRNAVRI
jgi:hypothetical protein